MYELLLTIIIIPAMIGQININLVQQEEIPTASPTAVSSQDIVANTISTPDYFVVDEKIGSVFGVVGDVALAGSPDGNSHIPFYAQNLTTGEITELLTLGDVVLYTVDTVCLQDRYLYFVMAGDFRVFIEDFNGDMPEYEHRILRFDSVEMTLEVVATYQAVDGLVYLSKVDDTHFLINQSVDTKTVLTGSIQLYDTVAKTLTAICSTEMTRKESSIYWMQWEERVGPSLLTGEKILCFDYDDGFVYALKASIESSVAYRLDAYDLEGNFVKTIPIPQMDGGYYQAGPHLFPFIQYIYVNNLYLLIEDFNPESAIVPFNSEGEMLPYAAFAGNFKLSYYADFSTPLAFLTERGRNSHYVLNNAECSLRKTLPLDRESYSETIFNFEDGMAVLSYVFRSGDRSGRRPPDIQRIRFFDSPQALDAALVTANDAVA